jgi:hypothetical protein
MNPRRNPFAPPVRQEMCLPSLSFAYSSSRRGRMEAIPHRDALTTTVGE